jgi:hypothetical protein
VRVTNVSTLIDKVKCWPVLILICSPESEVWIEHNWIWYILIFYSFLDIGPDSLIGKLRGVDSDDDESLISIFLIPSREIGSSSLTVYTAERPEVYKYYFSSKSLHRKWRRADPVSEHDLRSERIYFLGRWRFFFYDLYFF